MKFPLTVYFFSFIFYAHAQELVYTADKLEACYFSNNPTKLLSCIPLGKEVEIKYDTFFKGWSIRYTDRNNERQLMKLAYIQDTPNGYARVKDYKETIYVVDNEINDEGELWIHFEKPFDDGKSCTMSFTGIKYKEQIK
jgi:hypothetical protein